MFSLYPVRSRERGCVVPPLPLTILRLEGVLAVGLALTVGLSLTLGLPLTIRWALTIGLVTLIIVLAVTVLTSLVTPASLGSLTAVAVILTAVLPIWLVGSVEVDTRGYSPVAIIVVLVS